MSEALPKSADVVVVGAGCIGASAAVHLIRAGVRNVVLIDKDGPAAMTTGRSSAIVRQHYSQPTFARWARSSLAVWQDFSAQYGGDAVFTRTGWAIASGAADVEAMRGCIALLRSLGIDTLLLSQMELHELEPAADVSDFACVAYEPDAGYCDPRAASAGFAGAFEREGGTSVYGARVTALRRPGRTWSLETPLGVIETPTVVNAAGAYARWLAAQAGTQLPIQHYAHDVAVFRDATVHVALYDLLGGVYYRPDALGVLAGSMNWAEGGQVLEDPDAFHWQANSHVVTRYREAMQRRYPGSQPRLVHSHAGIYFVTPDRYPLLGEMPEAPGLFHAAGFSHGFKVSPAVGQAIADRLTRGPNASRELDEFRPSRFAEGQPITPLFPYVSGVQT